MGSTSKVKRYYSPEVETLAKELRGQQELHKMVCDTLKIRMYEKFDKHYNVWMQVIQTIANIDCLLALTKASETIGYPSCRPKLIEADKGCINFKELRHPCFVSTKEFIPNDVQLGVTNLILVFLLVPMLQEIDIDENNCIGNYLESNRMLHTS